MGHLICRVFALIIVMPCLFLQKAPITNSNYAYFSSWLSLNWTMEQKLMYRQESLTEKLPLLEYWINLHVCIIFSALQILSLEITTPASLLFFLLLSS